MSDRPVARAFVPGHVTGLFTVHRDEEPLKTGSRGAGMTLADGVTVEIRPAKETSLLVDGEPSTVESVERVLAAMDVSATVEVETDLPLGTGFGLSGGMALGTTLAANHVFGLAETENELTRIAHRAEVEAGTGLGDVVAQARGGLPIRLEPGAPPHGELDGIPAKGRVEVLPFGDLSTPDVLRERPDQITAAGTEALDSLLEQPTADQFMAASHRFAADVGLLTPELEAIIDDVAGNGGQASMAMLGETVFALGTDLTDAGYDPSVTSIHQSGATLLE